MNVLGLSWSDSIGSRFNGVSIKSRLEKLDVNYKLLTGSEPMLKEDWISPAFPNRMETNPTFQIINNLEAQSGFQSRLQWWTSNIFSREEYINAEIVHLHIIHNGWFRLESLKRISREKILVWTIHDPWILTGHCIYPYECLQWKEGCGNCPDLGRPLPVRRDRTKHEVIRKRSLMNSVKADVIVSTQWFKDQLDSYGLQSNSINVIPFGIELRDTTSLLGYKLSIKNKYLISVSEFVVMIRVSTEPQKGLNFALKALGRLRKNITIIAVDQYGKLSSLAADHKILEFGWIHDENELMNLYSAADVFIMPSIAETFGLMALEAMSCGTPVVYPRNTAIDEVVGADENFTYIEDGSGDNLGKVLNKLIINREVVDKESYRVRNRVSKKFDIQSYAAQTAHLYKKLLNAGR